jgi:TPR repeat protein
MSSRPLAVLLAAALIAVIAAAPARAAEPESARRIAELEKQLEAAKKREAELQQALQRETEARRRAEQKAGGASDAGALFEQALAKEREGDGQAAVKLYAQAARAGNGKAAKRLGEIYRHGIRGVPGDYSESMKWYNAARALGEDVPYPRRSATP